MLQDFLQEAGFYLGAERQDDGMFELAGLTDSGEDTSGRYILSVDEKIAGFAVTSPTASARGESELRAVFVKPDLRRKGVGRRLLSALFGKRPGAWIVEVPLAFAPAAGFFDATLHRFSKGGVSTTDFREGKNTRFARRWLQALPDRLVRHREEAGALLASDPFPFDRRHHEHRQGVLIAAALCSVATFPVAASTDSQLLTLLVSAVATILWLCYFEILVVGVLDRLDRGPIVPPVWDDKQ
jgi:predicted acetyltransferase